MQPSSSELSRETRVLGAPSPPYYRSPHPPVATPFQCCPWWPAHLQCMMDEWCSPYSSWPSTMKGCSGRAPPPSALAEDARVRGSAGSTCSSGQGSASGPLASGFFSAPCGCWSGDKAAGKGPAPRSTPRGMGPWPWHTGRFWMATGYRDEPRAVEVAPLALAPLPPCRR